MTAQQMIAKWHSGTRDKSTVRQEHVIDRCRLLDVNRIRTAA
jgi:hypothetical protein